MIYRLLILIFVPGLLLAQTQTTTVPTTPSVVPHKQPVQPTTTKQATAPAPEKPPLRTKPPFIPEKLPQKSRIVIGPEEHFFPHPGILFEKNGKWLGDDHLYNLTPDIGIFVEVEKAPDVTAQVDEKHIKNLVSYIFEKGSISPKPASEPPPFPYFHILVMVTGIDRGYSVYCAGRLFESVNVDRINLEKNVYFQVITWEKQALLVIPADKFRDELDIAITDITNNFVERYRHYEDIKLKNEPKR
jgi:hypothetical protein